MTTETNVERLERIKVDWVEEVQTYRFRQLCIEPEDIEFLIQQAERIQELEDYCSKSANFINQVELEKENARLRESLEFYAREKNWHEGWTQTIDGYVPDMPFAIADNGKKARQALKGESE